MEIVGVGLKAGPLSGLEAPFAHMPKCMVLAMVGAALVSPPELPF